MYDLDRARKTLDRQGCRSNQAHASVRSNRPKGPAASPRRRPRSAMPQSCPRRRPAGPSEKRRAPLRPMNTAASIVATVTSEKTTRDRNDSGDVVRCCRVHQQRDQRLARAEHEDNEQRLRSAASRCPARARGCVRCDERAGGCGRCRRHARAHDCARGRGARHGCCRGSRQARNPRAARQPGRRVSTSVPSRPAQTRDRARCRQSRAAAIPRSARRRRAAAMRSVLRRDHARSRASAMNGR